jgi:hypothetical protein
MNPLFQSRDREIRRANARRSPEERLAVMTSLQQSAFAMLESSEKGMAYFMQRNLACRRARMTHGKCEPISASRRAAYS